jgi:hypothetical protein
MEAAEPALGAIERSCHTGHQNLGGAGEEDEDKPFFFLQILLRKLINLFNKPIVSPAVLLSY